MRVMHQVLKRIYQDYAVIFPPARMSEINAVNQKLVEMDLGYLPQDFAEFLQFTNGLFWNGLEIFATQEHERDKGSYFHREIIKTQMLYTQNPMVKGKIILAYSNEDVVAYDCFRKEYQILDRYTYTIFIKFPKFMDIIYYYTKSLFEK